MNKNVLALAAGGLGICLFVPAVTVSAQETVANPFVDVATSDWSYQTMTEFANSGLIDKQDLVPDRTISRYEMGVLIAKALGREKKAAPAQVQQLDRLVDEYRNELSLIGVRFKSTEPKQDRIEYLGYLGFRYNNAQAGANHHGDHMEAHFSGQLSINLDKSTKIVYEILHHHDLNDSSQDNTFDNGIYGEANDWDKTSNQLYVDINRPRLHAQAGVFNYTPGYGMVTNWTDYAGAHVRGLLLTSGVKNFAATLFAGETEGTYGTKGAGFNHGKYYVGEAVYKADKNTNLKLVYHHLSPDMDAEQKLVAAGYITGVVHAYTEGTNFVEFGFDHQFGSKWNLEAAVVRSDADADKNKGYYAQLQYGNARFWAVPKSWDVFAAYRNIPAAATINGGLKSDFYGADMYDFRGWTYGFHYVPVRMQQLNVFYSSGHDVSLGSEARRTFRAQYDFFF